MAEALGVVASIVSILQLSDVVVRYLSKVRSASKDCSLLILEISSTAGVLGSLEKLVADQDGHEIGSWLPTVRLLECSGGPLDLYHKALERMKELLEPLVKTSKLSNHLTWPFKQNEIQELFDRIKRQHSLFNVALVSDHV